MTIPKISKLSMVILPVLICLFLLAFSPILWAEEASQPRGARHPFLGKDSSGNKNHLTFYGCSYSPNDAPPGYKGGSVYFDGNSYAVIGDPPCLDITGELTIEAWVKFDTIDGSSRGIVLKCTGDAGKESYRLLMEGKSLSGGISTHGGSYSNPMYGGGEAKGGSPRTGVWYYVAMTYKPGIAVKLYLNGKEVGSDTADIGESIWNSPSPVTIGASSGGGEYFKGKIADVRISNIARKITSKPRKPLKADQYTVGLWRLGKK